MINNMRSLNYEIDLSIDTGIGFSYESQFYLLACNQNRFNSETRNIVSFAGMFISECQWIDFCDCYVFSKNINESVNMDCLYLLDEESASRLLKKALAILKHQVTKHDAEHQLRVLKRYFYIAKRGFVSFLLNMYLLRAYSIKR